MPRDTSNPQIARLVDADEMSLEQRFAEWVSRQSADQEYDFCDIRRCPVAKFTGPRHEMQGRARYEWDELHSVFGRLLCEQPWTYSALADRLSLSMGRAE